MSLRELIEIVIRENAMIEHKKNELLKLKTLCEGTGISYEEKGGSTPNPDSVERRYLNYIEYKDKLKECIYDSLHNRKKLMSIIDTLEDRKEINLMYMYCFEGKTISAIARKMNYTRQRMYQMLNEIIDKLEKDYTEFD